MSQSQHALYRPTQLERAHASHLLVTFFNTPVDTDDNAEMRVSGRDAVPFLTTVSEKVAISILLMSLERNFNFDALFHLIYHIMRTVQLFSRSSFILSVWCRTKFASVDMVSSRPRECWNVDNEVCSYLQCSFFGWE